MLESTYKSSNAALQANEPSDDSLVRAAQRGDRQAYAELFRRYHHRLARVVARIARNSHDVEDIVQDSWIRAFTNIEGFNRESAFLTWITRIAINSALMHLRKVRTHNECALEEEYRGCGFPSFNIASASLDPEQACLAAERRAVMERAARRLSPTLREVFVLRYCRDKSLQEMAQETGLSYTAVKSRLLRARSALRIPPGVSQTRSRACREVRSHFPSTAMPQARRERS